VQRLDALTGMRGVAALLVVGFHAVLIVWLWQAFVGVPATAFAHPLSAWLFGGGWIGVDFFFVLSGFLLAWPLLKAARALPTAAGYRLFAAKRLLRIAPPYYASFLVVYALVGWSGNPVYRITPTSLLLHVLYLHNFFEAHQFAINGVAWTLAIELQFYLLLPILVQPFRWVGPAAAVPYAVAALLYEVWAYRAGHGDFFRTRFLAFQFPSFLGHFAFGIAAAQLMQRGWRPKGPPDLGVLMGLLLLVVPAVALGYTRQFDPIDVSFYRIALRPLAGLAFALIIFFALQPGSFAGRALATRPIVWLGDISYSLYLVHLAVGGAFLIPGARWPFAWGVPGFMALLFASSILVAWLFYQAVERPSLRLKDWLTARMEAARA
jgi:peptidoglycan/LPS O-acetylase OafA/YrhL